MAVMTSQYSEAVAFEQKTQPVPSSDKMALDLDINGTSTRDAIAHDSNEPALIKTTPSPSDALVADFPEINGKNLNAFSSNQTISTTTSEPLVESQSSFAAALPETNTTAESQLSNSPAGVLPSTSSLPSAEIAIAPTIDDLAPTTTVPPIVSAPESDLRDTTQLATPETSADEDSHHNLLDFSPDDEALATRTSELDVDPNSQTLDLNHTTSSAPAPDTIPQSIQEDTAATAKNEMNSPVAETHTSDLIAQDTAMADLPMADVSQLSSKVARDREDDDEVEPSAKRTKTEDVAAPNSPMENGTASTTQEDEQTITPYQSKEFIKIIKGVARTKDGKNFKIPVAKLWPNFAAAYKEKIAHEIDLETMEHRMQDGHYQTMKAFKDDIELLHQNALTFNGPSHDVTRSAEAVKNNLLSKISNAPSAPAPVVKKEKKPKRSTPAPDGAARGVARRVSKGAHGSTAPADGSFALDPTTNTPLIRRDSTKLDGGRPKREIHPPKNKDLPYSVRPKSKKNASELKFCETVLNDIWKFKNEDFVSPFTAPVDPVALNIPQYYTIIKKPMDLSTVSARLGNGTYTSSADFEKEMRQIFKNCFLFNPPGNPVNALGRRLEKFFEERWAKKAQYLAERSPAAASPVSAGESEDEDADDDEPADGQDSSVGPTLKDRLIEEQQKLLQLMGAKKGDPGMIALQQEMVAVIQKRFDDANMQSKSKKGKASKSSNSKKSTMPKKPATSKKSNSGKGKYLGTLEKETISAGLGALPDEISNEVLEDIKNERPGIDAGEDGTLELDIDMISVPLLWKIHGLIMRHAPEVQAEVRKTMQQDAPKPVSKAAPKKKNKPMSKQEQERSISTLDHILGDYQRHASGSQEPVMPTVEQEQEDESSGDEESDSEEE